MKADLQPRQQAKFLGVLLDSVGMAASLTPWRADRLLGMLGHFSLVGLVTAHGVQKLLGLTSAAAAVVPLGLLRARPLQCWFNAFCLHPKGDRQVMLRVSRACIRALHPLRDREFFLRGVPLGGLPHRRPVISTDVSLTVRGMWQPPWTLEHINVLELKAIHLALQRFLPVLQHQHLLVSTVSVTKGEQGPRGASNQLNPSLGR